MIRIFYAGLFLAICGCVSQPLSSVASQRDELIGIAKREMDRRDIYLPKDCEIAVDEGVTVFPVGKPRDEYVVRFIFSYRGKRDVYYKVIINKQSRKIDDFFDYRHTVPFRDG